MDCSATRILSLSITGHDSRPTLDLVARGYKLSADVQLAYSATQADREVYESIVNFNVKMFLIDNNFAML